MTLSPPRYDVSHETADSVELLIKEARRARRRRRLRIGALVMAALLAVAALMSVVAYFSSTKPSVNVVNKGFGAEDSRCLATQLLTRLSKSGVALGNASFAFKMTNTSAHSCFLHGAPNVQMMNGAGMKIPTHENLESSYFPFQSDPIRRVDLKSGESAMFDIGFVDSTGFENDQCPLASEILVTPTGSSRSSTIAVRFEPFGAGTVLHHQCGEIAVSPVMTAANLT
jgi:hypothetical protein